MARASLPRLSPRRRVVLATVALLVGLGAAFALATAGGLLEGRPEGIEVPPEGASAATLDDVAAFEPFAFEDGDPEDFLARGAAAYAHPLYAFSPGGAAASAERTARWRPEIEDAAERHDIDPGRLEALVMLESAGRPAVAAGDDPDGAVGLGQILPGTAEDLLDMRVDLAASKRTTRAIERERRRARRASKPRVKRAALRRRARLERRRRAVDERYDPERSLDGAGRYLAIAERSLGREDLATVSYHMGIGNLEDVIEAYVAPARPEPTTRATVAEHDVSYVRLFYDSSPLENPRTYRRLRRFDDDSRSYLFRVEAAREIMRLHREDPEELTRLARLHAAKASSEEVLRPPSEYEPYDGPEALRAAYDEGELLALPNEPARLGFSLDPAMGDLATGLRGADPRLYRGLRPQALATLLFITKEVRRVAGESGLRVTSGVRDLPYQARLGRSNPEATRDYSLHTTGYSFDIARDYPRPRVGRAFQYTLDRLRALRVIDYVYEPGAIHVTVGPEAERLLPLQEALVPAPD